MMTAESLLDEFLIQEDVSSRHSIVVRAEPEATYAALQEVRLSDSPIIRWLLRFRGLRTSSANLKQLRTSGFVRLAERPNEGLAMGIVGRFWKPAGDVRRLDAQQFREFHEPGTAKAVWVFVIEPLGPGECRVITSTRVACADLASRWKFRMYWLLVGPFSGLIRRECLRLIKERAERESGGSPLGLRQPKL